MGAWLRSRIARHARDPVEVRHQHVEYDGVGRLGPVREVRQCLVAVAGDLDVVPLELERAS